MQTQKIGSLNCRIIGEPESSALTVILCHGYGAPGTDLVPLANELFSFSPELAESVAFVFPEAPHDLSELGMPGGRAWWPINMQQLQEIMQTNNFEELTQSEPPGMDEAREAFRSFLKQFQIKNNLALDQILLGGFSQGAMLTTDATLRLEQAPAGLCIYSGTLLCQKEWEELAAGRKGLPVIQTHGTLDPVLPFAVAEQLKTLLVNAGLEVEFHSFAGMHTISWEALEMTAKLIQRLISNKQ